MVAIEGSSVFQTIGVKGTATPFLSTATAVKVKVLPLSAVPDAGVICTPTAPAPGPVYVSGTDTGAGGVEPGEDGVAVTPTGPPENTMTPAALR